MQFTIFPICLVSGIFITILGKFKKSSDFSCALENNNKIPSVGILNDADGVQSLSACSSNCLSRAQCSEVFFNSITGRCIISTSLGITQMIHSFGFIHLTSTSAKNTIRRIFDTSYYVPVYEEKTWLEAQRECKRNGSKLVEIETIEEFNFVQRIAQDINSGFVFIGGTNAGGGQMVWWSSLDPVNVDTNWWSPGEPNNYMNNEHCLNLYGDFKYKLNDAPCDEFYPFICEWNHV